MTSLIRTWTLCLLLVSAGAGAAAPTPTETVHVAVDRVFDVLRQPGLSQAQRWSDIGAVINERFDFRSMSQSVLATSWKEASTEEKRQFVEYFSQFLEDTYRNRIEAITSSRVEYLGEQVRNDRATVDTLVITPERRVPITYRLKNNEGQWMAYDVVIDGDSLVNNYRDTFSAIVKAGGMDGLLTDLEGRIANYKQKHGAATGK